jgi:uncharacterized protein
VIKHSISDGRIVFNVKVVPRSSRTEIVGEQNGVLRVRIVAPPVDGAANKELIRALAKHFAVRTGAVNIISGQSSRTKKVSIDGISSDQLRAMGL